MVKNPPRTAVDEAPIPDRETKIPPASRLQALELWSLRTTGRVNAPQQSFLLTGRRLRRPQLKPPWKSLTLLSYSEKRIIANFKLQLWTPCAGATAQPDRHGSQLPLHHAVPGTWPRLRAKVREAPGPSVSRSP